VSGVESEKEELASKRKAMRLQRSQLSCECERIIPKFRLGGRRNNMKAR